MKILCVGQNYAKHVAELGSAPSSEPVWFWKPDTAIVTPAEPIRIPTDIGAIHHEVELAIRVGSDGTPDAFTVAIDVTARDMQAACKKAGKPWTQAKGYDTFLPLAGWIPSQGINLNDLPLQLWVNGELRQSGSTSEMTRTVAELLAAAATWTTLNPGDVLLTGTPHGVGPIVNGDTIRAEVTGHVAAEWTVESR